MTNKIKQEIIDIFAPLNFPSGKIDIQNVRFDEEVRVCTKSKLERALDEYATHILREVLGEERVLNRRYHETVYREIIGHNTHRQACIIRAKGKFNIEI